MKISRQNSLLVTERFSKYDGLMLTYAGFMLIFPRILDMATLYVFKRRIFHLLSGLVFLFACQTRAATFVINDINDTVKITSLRGAIIAANRIGRDSTIILGMARGPRDRQQRSWIYRLTIPGADEDNARTGDLDITRGNLTIIGVSPDVTIDATGLGDRVFQVSSNAHLTLENLTITGGTAPQAEFGNFYRPTRDAEPGGAIYNAGVLTLQGCVITNNSSGDGNGNPGNGSGKDGGDGGGIYNSGVMRATRCMIAGNSSGAGVDGAEGGGGGGIRNDGVSFLTDCVINGNQCGAGGAPAGNAIGFGGYGGLGGGILNFGTMTLNSCVIGRNMAGLGADSTAPGIGSIGTPGTGGGWGGSGGGIYNNGQMQLIFSTVHDNQAGYGGNGGDGGSGGDGGPGGDGAGIFNGGSLLLNTCTISGNLCGVGGSGGVGWFYAGGTGGDGGNGGGIYSEGTLRLTSCTVAFNETGPGGNGGNSFNSASPAIGGRGGDGGGILNDVSNTNIVMRNSLIALNLPNAGGLGGTNYDYSVGTTTGDPGANGFGFDLVGDFTSQGFNLIGMADGSTGFTNGVHADQVGSSANPIDPRLGPLQMNGGFTPTHALLWGSPAIDQGNCFGIHRDQRGHYRPYIFPSIPAVPGGDGSDIGSFELDTN